MKSLVRSVVERASRGVVLRRRLPARYGSLPIYVSPDAALRFWRRDLESTDPMVLGFADRYVSPGDVVWDVGANVGLFSFTAAHKAGRRGAVYAMEPDQFLVGLLRRSATVNHGRCAQVRVIPAAVSNEMSIQEFAIAERGRASNHLAIEGGSTQTGGVRENVPVLTVTLEWLATQLPIPNVIKIDAESSELRILESSIEFLRHQRPKIICEVGPEYREPITAIFRSLNYTLYNAEAPHDGPITAAAHDTVAVPDPRPSSSVLIEYKEPAAVPGP